MAIRVSEVLTSQTLISPSSRIAPTRRVPHGEKVSPLVLRVSDFCCSMTRWISSELPLYKVVSKSFVVGNEKSCSPRSTSQRRTRPSCEAVAKFLPSGWNTAHALIVSICPLNTCRFSHLRASHTIILSGQMLMRYSAVGENARRYTYLLCPVSSTTSVPDTRFQILMTPTLRVEVLSLVANSFSQGEKALELGRSGAAKDGNIRSIRRCAIFQNRIPVCPRVPQTSVLPSLKKLTNWNWYCVYVPAKRLLLMENPLSIHEAHRVR